MTDEEKVQLEQWKIAIKRLIEMARALMDREEGRIVHFEDLNRRAILEHAISPDDRQTGSALFWAMEEELSNVLLSVNKWVGLHGEKSQLSEDQEILLNIQQRVRELVVQFRKIPFFGPDFGKKP